jgi:transcriptional regulator with XRE-family HTH domain
VLTIPKRTNRSLQEPETDPLVFLINGRRQWYGQAALSQMELSELANVSHKIVQRYERQRSLPGHLRQLLRLSIALQVPLEKLIAPQIFDRLLDEINARRRAWADRRNAR